MSGCVHDVLSRHNGNKRVWLNVEVWLLYIEGVTLVTYSSMV